MTERQRSPFAALAARSWSIVTSGSSPIGFSKSRKKVRYQPSVADEVSERRDDRAVRARDASRRAARG